MFLLAAKVERNESPESKPRELRALEPKNVHSENCESWNQDQRTEDQAQLSLAQGYINYS